MQLDAFYRYPALQNKTFKPSLNFNMDKHAKDYQIFRRDGKTFRLFADGTLQVFSPATNYGMGEMGGFWKTLKKVALVGGAGYLAYRGYQNYQASGNIFKSAPSNKTVSVSNPRVTYRAPQVGSDYPDYRTTSPQPSVKSAPFDWDKVGDTALRVADIYTQQAQMQTQMPNFAPMDYGVQQPSFSPSSYAPMSAPINTDSNAPVNLPVQSSGGIDTKTMMIIGGVALVGVLLIAKK